MKWHEMAREALPDVLNVQDCENQDFRFSSINSRKKKKTILKGNPSFWVKIRYLKHVKIPVDIAAKHLIPMETICSLEDYKTAAVELSKNRTGVTQNTVFENCDSWYKVEVEDKSQSNLFTGDDVLFVSVRPLITMQCEVNEDNVWECINVSQRYAFFSADTEHFLKFSLQLFPNNIRIDTRK